MHTYLVVGGSSGIGYETCRQLLSAGHQVVVIGRNKPDLPVTFFQSDVVANDTLPVWDEPLNGLVYCPGSIRLKPFKGLTASDFEEDLRINYLGLVKALHHYHPALKRSGNASVVVFSTVAVKTG
ncbi:MAG: SDR family oxidoreductase, partial [Chitinophagales bacterium]|nr:SDR family oxidoreductase [Chitinophagales bacterium]